MNVPRDICFKTGIGYQGVVQQHINYSGLPELANGYIPEMSRLASAANNAGEGFLRPPQLRGAEISTDGYLKLANSMDTLSVEGVQNVISRTQKLHYPTGAQYSGIAFIVNVVTFDNDPESYRLGAHKDTDELTKILQKRNFLVYHLTDPTYLQLEGAIEQMRTYNNYESADSLLIVVMSHGDGEKIVTKDRKRFEIWRRIVEQFNNINCKVLKGKPKIFIFNYCRGDMTDLGTSSTQHDALTERINPLTIPSSTDMLVCYSTLDGHYAYRDVNEGSWFIQTLCKVWNQHGERCDIIKLLNQVSEYMKSLECENGGKQICPYYNIGFTKKFYI